MNGNSTNETYIIVEKSMLCFNTVCFKPGDRILAWVFIYRCLSLSFSVLLWASSITTIYQSSSSFPNQLSVDRVRAVYWADILKEDWLVETEWVPCFNYFLSVGKRGRTESRRKTEKPSIYLRSQRHSFGMIIYVSGPYLSQQIACDVQDNGADGTRHRSSTMLDVRGKAERH